MPGLPATSGSSGFNDRLAAAMHQARSKQSTTTASAPTSTPPQSDKFADRLSNAMVQARGEEPAAAAEEAPPAGADGGPVGQGDYVVRDPDTIPSIATDTGHFWETIWSDPANAELKSVRKDPNVLLPGDRVTIPPMSHKQESGETEMRHRFVRRGTPSVCRFQVLDDGRPRANQNYTLHVDSLVFEGVTDAEGKLEHRIPADANSGELVIGPESATFHLNFGCLAPISALRGIRERLHNLGFPCDSAADELDQDTREALRAFQRRVSLPETGEPDADTVERLGELHDSPDAFPESDEPAEN